MTNKFPTKGREINQTIFQFKNCQNIKKNLEPNSENSTIFARAEAQDGTDQKTTGSNSTW